MVMLSMKRRMEGRVELGREILMDEENMGCSDS